MVIKIVQEKRPGELDLHCPETFCDVCRERVEDAREGNFLYRVDVQFEPVDGVIYHVHKRCNQTLEAGLPSPVGGRWHCNELRRLPMHIGANLGFDAARLSEVVETVREGEGEGS